MYGSYYFHWWIVPDQKLSKTAPLDKERENSFWNRPLDRRKRSPDRTYEYNMPIWHPQSVTYRTLNISLICTWLCSVICERTDNLWSFPYSKYDGEYFFELLLTKKWCTYMEKHFWTFEVDAYSKWIGSNQYTLFTFILVWSHGGIFWVFKSRFSFSWLWSISRDINTSSSIDPREWVEIYSDSIKNVEK